MDIADFGVFSRGAKEVHILEKVCLRILNWKLGVSEKEFKLYDNAILKPIMENSDEALKTRERRKSITMASSEFCEKEALHSAKKASTVNKIRKTKATASSSSPSGIPSYAMSASHPLT